MSSAAHSGPRHFLRTFRTREAELPAGAVIRWIVNPTDSDPTSVSVDVEVGLRAANVYLPASGGAEVTVADFGSGEVAPQYREIASVDDVDALLDDVIAFLLAEPAQDDG